MSIPLEENGCRLWVWSRKAKTERFVSLVRQVFPKLLEFLLFFAKSPNICLGQLQKSASYVVKNESCPLLAPFSRESPISKYSWTRTGRSGYAAGIGRTTSRRRTSAATSTTNRREPCLFSSTTTKTKTPLPTKITSYRKTIFVSENHMVALSKTKRKVNSSDADHIFKRTEEDKPTRSTSWAKSTPRATRNRSKLTAVLMSLRSTTDCMCRSKCHLHLSHFVETVLPARILATHY